MKRILAVSLIVASAAGLAFLVYRHAYFAGLRSSDGANYAAVARNYAEGRGLVSPVVQPGLLGLVATTRSGQPFVIQAPLWPLLLGHAFRVFGASENTLLAVGGALLSLLAVSTFWLAWLMTRSWNWAVLAVALLLTHPYMIGHSLAGTNVMLQAALISACFLLAWLAPSWWVAVLMGAVVGLGCVARENTALLIPALVLVWHRRLSLAEPQAPGRSPRLIGFRNRATLRAWLGLVATLILLAGLPVALEAVRKAELLGRFDAPVLRLTFLYHTPAADSGWYYIYDHPMLRLDPVAYFRAHPGLLYDKMLYQIDVAFLRQTLPILTGFVPALLPVVLPWLWSQSRARWLGYALLVTIGAQVLAGSMASLHFTYFLAFLPIALASVAATAASLWSRFRASPVGSPRAWLLALTVLYAIAPLAGNSILLLRGAKPGLGDYSMSVAAEEQLVKFVLEHTAADSVIACSYASLVAWKTRRVVVMYSHHPDFTIGDTPMWRKIDELLPIDYVLLNGAVPESPGRGMLAGFELLETASAEAGPLWLFRRPATVP